MKQRIFIAITVLLVTIIALLVVRYGAINPRKTLKDTMPVVTYHLSNGLMVVAVENHRVPAISHTMFVKVGSADDPLGKTGLAHYAEHLAFKGTETVSGEDYNRRMASMGAETNAYTTEDYTAYYVNAPKAVLEQVMALESDRFMNLVIDDASAATERDVVREERRTRVDARPISQLREQMEAIRFLIHPYRLPAIGWAQDIERFTAQDARRFFARHYVPSTMVLVVAGDVTPKEVRRLAMRYYGGMPSRRAPARPWTNTRTIEPPAIADRAVTLRDVRVKQRQWLRDYTAPSLGTPTATTATPRDTVALEMAAYWLGGKSGILQRVLVEQEKLAVSVNVGYDDTRIGPSALSFHIIPRDGVTLETLQTVFEKTLASAISAGPDVSEVTRARTLYHASITYASDGLSTIASYIGTLMMVGRDEQFFYGLPALVDSIHAEDMQRVAKQVLIDGHSVTGLLLPVVASGTNSPANLSTDMSAATGDDMSDTGDVR
jgi:zinc protease